MRADPMARRDRIALWLVPVVPLLVTLGRFRNRFVYDDAFVIERGTVIHDWSRVWEVFSAHTMIVSTQEQAAGSTSLDTYRPVTLVTFFVDAAWSGHSPFGYHLTNALLHSCAALLLVLFARRAFGPGAELRAAFVALAWALLPMSAEAHVWINGRSDVLSAAFGLLAGLCVLRYFEGGSLARAWLAGVFACGVAAMLSKETIVLGLPFLVLVPVRASWRQRLAAAVPIGAAVALYLALRVHALGGLRIGGGGDAGRASPALRHLGVLLVDSLRCMIVPVPYHLRSLRDDYAALPSWADAAAVALCLGIAIAALWALRKRPWVGWGLAWVFVTVSPVITVTGTLWPGFGRFLYLPAIGLWLAVGDLAGALLGARPHLARVTGYVGVLFLVVSAAGLLSATATFHSDETLYADAAGYAPSHAFAPGFLGLSLRRANRCSDALPLLLLADRRAPTEPRYLVAAAKCALVLGQVEQASRMAEAGMQRFRNTRPEAGFLIVRAAAGANEAMSTRTGWLERCLQIDPHRTDCAEMLAQMRAGARAR